MLNRLIPLKIQLNPRFRSVWGALICSIHGVYTRGLSGVIKRCWVMPIDNSFMGYLVGKNALRRVFVGVKWGIERGWRRTEMRSRKSWGGHNHFYHPLWGLNTKYKYLTWLCRITKKFHVQSSAAQLGQGRFLLTFKYA